MKCTYPLKHVLFKYYLVSREYCALKFSIYIPQNIGDNFIPNLMFCDVFHFIVNLTPLGDLDCDSADCEK